MYEEEEAVVEDFPAQNTQAKPAAQQAGDDGCNQSRNSPSPQPFVERWRTNSYSNVGKLRNIFSVRSRPKTTASGTLVSDSESRSVTPEVLDEPTDQALGDRSSFDKLSTYRPEERPSVKDEFEETKQDNNEFNLTPSRLSEELRLNSQKLQQLGSIIEWKDRRIARLEDAIRKLETAQTEESSFDGATSASNRGKPTDNATETAITEINEQCTQVSPEEELTDGERKVSKEVAELRSGLMEKDSKLQDTKTDLWGVTIEYEQLEEKFDQVGQDLDKALHDLDATRTDLSMFRRKIENSEARRFHLEEVIQVKDLQIRQLLLQIDNSANVRADMSMCFLQIDEHIQNLEASFRDKNFSVASMEEEIGELHFMTEQSSYRERRVAEELERKCNRLSERDQDINHLHEQLDSKHKAYLNLQEVVESQRNELDKLKSNLRFSNDNMQEFNREELHEKDAACYDMSNEIWLLRERCAELERINTDLKYPTANEERFCGNDETSCPISTEAKPTPCNFKLGEGNGPQISECIDEEGKYSDQSNTESAEQENGNPKDHSHQELQSAAGANINQEHKGIQKTDEQQSKQLDENYVLSLEAELHVVKIINAALADHLILNDMQNFEKVEIDEADDDDRLSCCRWSPSSDNVECLGRQESHNKEWLDQFDELLENSWSTLEKLEQVHEESSSGKDLPEEQPELHCNEEQGDAVDQSPLSHKEQDFVPEYTPIFEHEQQDSCVEKRLRCEDNGFGNDNDEQDDNSYLLQENCNTQLQHNGDFRLHQIISFLEEEKVVMERDLNEASEKSTWFEQENNRVHLQLSSMGDHSRELEVRLEKLQEEHRNVKHETDDAKAQLRRIISTLSELHEKAAHNAQSNQGQVKALQQDLEEALESENVLKDSLAQKIQELTDLSENFESVRGAHQQVCNDMECMKGDLARTSEQLANCENQLVERNSEFQRKSQEILKLRQSVEEQDNSRTSMEDEIGVAQERIQALEDGSEKHSQQMIEAEQEIEDITSSKADLEALLRKSDGQLQQALNDLQFFRDQLSTLERGNTELEEQVRTKNHEQGHYSKLQESLGRKITELENVQQELQSKHQQLNDLAEQFHTVENELQNMHQQEQFYQARIQELQIDRVDVGKELSGVDVELERLRGLLEIAAKSAGLNEEDLWSARSSEASAVHEPHFLENVNLPGAAQEYDQSKNLYVPRVANESEVAEDTDVNFSGDPACDVEQQQQSIPNNSHTEVRDSSKSSSLNQRSELQLAQAEIAVLRSENVNLELKHSDVEAVIEKQHEALMAAANDLLEVRENLQRDIKEMRDVTRMTILNQDQQCSSLRKQLSRSSFGGYENKSRSSILTGQSENSNPMVRELVEFCDVTMRRMADENRKCQNVMGQLVEKHTELLDTMGKKLRRMDQSDKTLVDLNDGARNYSEMASELKGIIAQLVERGPELVEKTSETTVRNLQKHLQQLNDILSVIKTKKSKLSNIPDSDAKKKQNQSSTSSSSTASEEIQMQSKKFVARHSHLPNELEDLCDRLVEADKEVRAWRSHGSLNPPSHRRKVSFAGSSGESATATPPSGRRGETACTCSVSRKQAGGDLPTSFTKRRPDERAATLQDITYRVDRRRRD